MPSTSYLANNLLLTLHEPISCWVKLYKYRCDPFSQTYYSPTPTSPLHHHNLQIEIQLGGSIFHLLASLHPHNCIDSGESCPSYQSKECYVFVESNCLKCSFPHGQLFYILFQWISLYWQWLINHVFCQTELLLKTFFLLKTAVRLASVTWNWLQEIILPLCIT